MRKMVLSSVTDWGALRCGNAPAVSFMRACGNAPIVGRSLDWRAFGHKRVDADGAAPKRKAKASKAQREGKSSERGALRGAKSKVQRGSWPEETAGGARVAKEGGQLVGTRGDGRNEGMEQTAAGTSGGGEALAGQMDPLGRAPATLSQPRRRDEAPTRRFPKLQPLSPEILEFFASRKISRETLERNKVMMMVKRRTPYIAFQYFRNGELINIKCRSLHKRFFQV